MPPRTPLHPPKQERSRRTLRRIVEAARELVAERGVDATSVQQIVERAGSSVGSFYARFGGKDDLLDYLEQGVWEEARRRWDEALEGREWQERPLPELVTGLVQVLLEVERYEADVRRALRLRRAAGGEPEPARAFREHVRRGLEGLLLAHAGEMAHPDPARAVEVGLPAVVGGLRELERRGGLDDEEIVAELGRLLLSYLGSGAPPAERERAGVEFFDVWG